MAFLVRLERTSAGERQYTRHGECSRRQQTRLRQGGSTIQTADRRRVARTTLVKGTAQGDAPRGRLILAYRRAEGGLVLKAGQAGLFAAVLVYLPAGRGWGCQELIPPGRFAGKGQAVALRVNEKARKSGTGTIEGMPQSSE